MSAVDETPNTTIYSTSSSNLSLLSLGSVNSDTSVKSFLDSDDGLLSTEGTLIECVAYIWGFVIKKITETVHPTDIQVMSNNTDSTTYLKAEKLKDYIRKLNIFTEKYKENKNKDYKDEVVWIKELETLYTEIQYENIKPAKDEITEIFTLALESQSLRNMFMPNDLEPDSSGLKLTPEQIKIFQIEVASDRVNRKLGKLLKVEQVIHNLMSRLKLRKLVLNRSRRTSPNIPVGEQQPTFAEKFLDVVHNMDTALTWIDEPAANNIDSTEELEELRKIRATIFDKLTNLQSELTGQPCGEESTQKAMELVNDNDESIFTFPSSNTNSLKKRSFEPYKSNIKSDIPEKKVKQCVEEPLSQTLKDTLTPVVEEAKSIVEPVADEAITIQTLLTQLNEAKSELQKETIVQELNQNETLSFDPVPSNDEVMLDINFILGIYTPESPTPAPAGGKRKKPHKITRRNKQKGSNRRRPNKKRKTAKHAKRFTKKH
jgi:hypothetical protein